MTPKHVVRYISKQLENAITLSEVNDAIAVALAHHFINSFDLDDYKLLSKESEEAKARVLMMDQFVSMFNDKDRIPTGDDQNSEDPCDLGLSFQTIFP